MHAQKKTTLSPIYMKQCVLLFAPVEHLLEPFQDGSISWESRQGMAPGHGRNAGVGRAFFSVSVQSEGEGTYFGGCSLSPGFKSPNVRG